MDFDASRERIESGQRHHTTCYLLATPKEGLVKLGCVDAVQPYAFPSDNHGVAIDNRCCAGETFRTLSVLRHVQEIKCEKPKHSATEYRRTLHE